MAMRKTNLKTMARKALISTQLAVSSPKQQKGATALEYVVLAAAIIIVIGVLATNSDTVGGYLTSAFENLFSDAQSVGGQ